MAAINFWGTWCGPCVIEMPGVQEVDDRFADDPDVVVLNLTNDEGAFPTTWFIDRDGRTWFENRGWSEELDQEFTWRVEALKGG